MFWFIQLPSPVLRVVIKHAKSDTKLQHHLHFGHWNTSVPTSVLIYYWALVHQWSLYIILHLNREERSLPELYTGFQCQFWDCLVHLCFFFFLLFIYCNSYIDHFFCRLLAVRMFHWLFSFFVCLIIQNMQTLTLPCNWTHWWLTIAIIINNYLAIVNDAVYLHGSRHWLHAKTTRCMKIVQSVFSF